MEAHLMTLVYAKKSTHPGGEKHKNHSSPSKKKQATEKSTKKHYIAFKSTRYNPCGISSRIEYPTVSFLSSRYLKLLQSIINYRFLLPSENRKAYITTQNIVVTTDKVCM